METSNNPLPHVTDVYFFGTCVLDIFMPEAGMDAMTLLEQQAYACTIRKSKAAADSLPIPRAVPKKPWLWQKSN